jgi:hypothetical protein
MDYHPVLNIHVISYPYVMNVAANHGIEPNAAIVAQNNIAREGGIVGKKAPFAPFGINSFYRFY